MKGKPPASRSVASTKEVGLVGTLLEIVRPVLITIGTTALGVLGVWLTPVKTVVMHMLYKEDARVILSADVDRINVGQTVHVRAFIAPSGPLPIADGRFDIVYNQSLVRLTSGQSPILTPSTDVSREVPNQEGWTFVAINPGTATFRGALQTRYGTYPRLPGGGHATSTSSALSSTANIEILTNETDPHATRDDFSGKWKIRLGDVDGTMVLKQLGDKIWSPIPGHYELEDGTHGAINEGYHDGHVFGGQLINGDSVTKWSLVDLPFVVTDDGFIKVEGQATLLKADSTGWKKVGTKLFKAEIALN
jgi:hypothetical protein